MSGDGKQESEGSNAKQALSQGLQVPGIVQQQKQPSNSSVELAAWRKARVEAGKRGETLRD